MTANPITDRLMRHARPPSIRAALWGAFGLGLLTLVRAAAACCGSGGGNGNQRAGARRSA